MDYNRQFQKLLKEAKENGYEFKNGTFTINQEEFHPVMEVMLQWHTTYESQGWYYIYKKTFQIDEKDFETIMEYIKNNNGIEFNFDSNEEFYDVYDAIILKYLNKDPMCDVFVASDFDGNVRLLHDTFSKYTDADQCGDIQFTPIREQSQFPYGYISFYTMNNSDFANTQDVNLVLEKFMRYN